MPTLTLKSKFRKNEGLLISVDELKALYFYGVSIKSKDGSELPSETIRTYIKSAQAEIEGYLGIKLVSQIIDESFDFFSDEFREFGYMKVSFPVKKAFSLDGFLGTIRQIQYPADWMSVRKTNDGESYFRQMFLVPNQGSATSFPVTYSGIFPAWGLMGYNKVPNYWQAVYCTGFDKIPYELLNVIGMMSAIPLFDIAGDLILGAGIASQSLGVDGLSQSISSTASATSSGYNARVMSYRKSVDKTLERMKSKYKGANLTAL